MHARSVRVEDASDPDVNPVLIVVAVGEGFGYSLAFVVARSRTDRIDVAVVGLWLRMNVWISIHFGCACQKEARLGSFCQSEGVERTHKVGLDRLDLVGLV